MCRFPAKRERQEKSLRAEPHLSAETKTCCLVSLIAGRERAELSVKEVSPWAGTEGPERRADSPPGAAGQALSAQHHRSHLAVKVRNTLKRLIRAIAATG